MDYVFCKFKPGKHACRLKTLQDVDDTFELLKGVTRKRGWPESAYFKMSESFPNDLLTEDFISNREKALVVSERVREFVEAKKLKNAEFLPVGIVNHKGRRIDEKYFVLNLLEIQDCIDMKASKYTQNKIDPEEFMAITKLVINEDKVGSDLLLFRPKRYADLPIAHRSFADAVTAAGFTGIKFGEIKDWNGA